MKWFACVLFGLLMGNAHLLLKPHPDIDLSIGDLMAKYGYPLEKYTIETEDGYILTTFRIPHGKNSTVVGTPILFVPGTGGCSENFLILGENDAIAYYLADRGFDIWLMNQRGTTHSRKHKFLDATKDPEYWEFGWHEVGVYDIPSNIDFILNVTKHEKLIYIGHSQGTTTYFVTTSDKPEYNEKIIVGVQFAMAMFLKDLHVPFMDFAGKYHREIQAILKILNIRYIMPDNEEFLSSLKVFCGLENWTADLCGKILNLLGAEDLSFYSFNNTFTPIIFRNAPAGASVRQLIHYFQMMETGEFTHYDYGPDKNLQVYNSVYPPLYDLSKCTAPVAIFEGKADFETTDEARLKYFREIPNIIYYYQIKDDHFHHADFIWGNNVKELVNKPVYKFLKRMDKRYRRRLLN